MDKEMWDKARVHLHEKVEAFMKDQQVYMTQSPEDFKESNPEDFLIWFIESF